MVIKWQENGDKNKNGDKMAIKWNKMVTKWGQNGDNMATKCDKNWVKMATKWGKNGEKMGSKWR